MAGRIIEEGWRLLNVANESLQFDIRATSPKGYAVLSRRDFSSSADVFSAIFSRQFIFSVLEDILQSNTDAFCHTLVEEECAMLLSQQGMCIWPLLVGVDSRPRSDCGTEGQGHILECSQMDGREMHGALKWFSKDFARTKSALNRQLQRMLSSLGEVLCGNEKLFRFTGRGGIVRKVPKKPARMALPSYCPPLN